MARRLQLAKIDEVKDIILIPLMCLSSVKTSFDVRNGRNVFCAI